MANRRVEEKLSELHQRGLAKPEAAIPSPYVRAESKPRIKTGKPGHVDLYPPLPPHEPFTYNLNLHPGGGYDFPGAAIGKGGSIVREIRQRTGTWLVVCDEQGPLDGRRPPADADVYVRISAHDSSEMGLEAIRAAANRVAELWSPTNAGFKPFTVRFGDAIRLQPDWDRLTDDSGAEYLAPPPPTSGHGSSSSAVKPPPPPPPKLQPQSPPAAAAPVVQPLQPPGLTSAWGQQPPVNQQSSAAAVVAATALDPLAGARLSDSPFLQQQQPPQQQQQPQPETNAPPAAWDPWQQQGARDVSQQPAAAGGGLGHFSLWDTIGAEDPLSGLGAGAGLGMDAMSQAAAPAWPSSIAAAGSGATWGAPSVVTGGSWASMASTAAADDRLAAMTVQQQLGQGDQHLPSAPPGWPGSGLGQPAALMNTTTHNNNKAPGGGGTADSNSETMKAEDSSDVEVQDLLSLLTCK